MNFSHHRLRAPPRAPPPHFVPFIKMCVVFFIVLIKIALVICNFRYDVLPSLQNDGDYGRKIAQTLSTMGFTV